MKLPVRMLVGALIAVVAVLALVLSCPDEARLKLSSRSLKPESGSVTEKVKGQALSTEPRWTADYQNHRLWATVGAYQGATKSSGSWGSPERGFA